MKCSVRPIVGESRLRWQTNLSGSVRPFFFSSRRRHTISLCDWSSDVCSSDLIRADRNRASRQALIDLEAAYVRAFNARDARLLDRLIAEDYLLTGPDGVTIGKADRSEERRVGKEWERTVYA